MKSDVQNRNAPQPGFETVSLAIRALTLRAEVR